MMKCQLSSGMHGVSVVKWNAWSVSCQVECMECQLSSGMHGVSVVKWNAWGVVKSVNPKTGKEITKRQEVVKSGPPSELVATFIVELESLSVHLFEAWWQQEQFSELGKNFPEKAVVLTIDFAENYTCFCQNEIQGAH